MIEATGNASAVAEVLAPEGRLPKSLFQGDLLEASTIAGAAAGGSVPKVPFRLPVSLGRMSQRDAMRAVNVARGEMRQNAWMVATLQARLLAVAIPADCTTVYRMIEHGTWRVVEHQQLPPVMVGTTE